jgi:hypothetical protein
MFAFFGRNYDSIAITQLPLDSMPNKTDSSSAFKMPAASDSGPLHTLSPERVNAARVASNVSTTTTYKSTTTSETESLDIQSSPTRRAKANLFGDYSPNKHAPTANVTGFALPQSPSLPEIHALRPHVRTNSDVQGLVKRFEHLDVRDRDAESTERRKRHEAELRRAQIAREEAESDVKRLREEVRRLKKEGDDGRDRERKVARRLEVVQVRQPISRTPNENHALLILEQEELTTAKSSHDSQCSVYEKEMRKARKEAFKSSSQVLKFQEELKSTRNTLRITQSGLDLEKQKVQRKEQERFEMEYQLIPLQEQVDKLKQKLKVVEEEREALKTNLKEVEVARIAAEGLIALPVSETMDLDLLSSPRKAPSPQKTRSMFDVLEEDKENLGASPRKASETRRLAEELDHERKRREHVEDMVDFLRMECQFKCCGCRNASNSGHQLAVELDAELAAAVERIRAGMQHILTPRRSFDEGYGTQEDGSQQAVVPVASQVEESHADLQSQEPTVAAIDTAMTDDAERSQTFGVESPSQNRSPGDQLLDEEEEWLSNSPPKPRRPTPPVEIAVVGTMDLRPSTPPPQAHHPQQSPFRNQPSIRTVTTTTTVPIQFTPISKPLKPFSVPTDSESAIEDAENIPPTPSTAAALDGLPPFDREAALKMIEYRRGRAKSIADGHATPRKQMLEGVNGRRDISAPTLGQKMPSAAKPLGGSARGRR